MSEELEQFVRDEQQALWGDLESALRAAINGAWSIAASAYARRIVRAALLIGPTPYEEISWSLVAGGVYEALLRAGGIEPELPDEAEWGRLEVLMARHDGTRETQQPAYAATVAAINSDRERRWISGMDE